MVRVQGYEGTAPQALEDQFDVRLAVEVLRQGPAQLASRGQPLDAQWGAGLGICRSGGSETRVHHPGGWH